jgi:hypothetical protein
MMEALPETETPVGGSAGVSETDDQGIWGMCDRPVDGTAGHDREFQVRDLRSWAGLRCVFGSLIPRFG